MKYLFAVAILFCSLHSTAFASLQITEVMYDPKSGGEWVEVYNPDDTAIDLKGWKLFDGASHSISTSAQLLLPAGSYIILADDKNAFISAFNNVTVPVIDIVTSMNNDGDTVILRNPSGTDISTVVYSANAGASKNDKSLQLVGTEYLPWFTSIGTATTVTKEEINSATPATNTTTTPTPSSGTVVSTQTTSPYHAWPSDMELFVSAGGDKVSVAGAEVVFQGRVLSAARKSLPNADLIWTFGDGGSDRGTGVKHTFHYPGRYVVLLDVISGDNIAKDQIFVEVVQPKISISHVELGEHTYVEIYNNSIYDLDIGGWILEANGLVGTHFVIPKNTIVLAGRKVIFPSEITKLLIINNTVRLKFPNDGVVAEYLQATTTPEIKENNPEGPSEGNLAVEETSSVNSIQNLVGGFLSSHITKSLFDDSSQELEGDPLLATGTQSTTTDIVEQAIQADNQTLAAAASSGFDLQAYTKLVWVILLIVGIVSIVVAVRYIDKLERKENDLTEEVDEYQIIE